MQAREDLWQMWCGFVRVMGGGDRNGLCSFPSASKGTDRFIKFLPGFLDGVNF